MSDSANFLRDIGNETIPLYVGTLFNCTLFGVLLVQICIYFLAFPHDRRRDKTLVWAILAVEIVQTISNIKDKSRVFGHGWGDPSELNKVGMVWFNVPLLGSIVAAVGQTFFAYRIYIIGKSWYLPAFITLMSLAQCGAGIWTGVIIDERGTFSNLQFNFFKAPAAWLILTAANDIVIVVGTYYCLLKARAPGFSRATENMLSRVMKVTTITGLVCAVLALSDLTIFAVFPQASFHLGLCMGLSKVYSNSILVILNSRARISLRRDEAPSEVSGLNFRLTGLKTGGGADTGFETRQSTDT